MTRERAGWVSSRESHAPRSYYHQLPPAARDSIEQLLDETLALSRQCGAKTWELFIHLTRAEVASRLAEEATRERELREAHRPFTEIGASIRAAEVRRNSIDELLVVRGFQRG